MTSLITVQRLRELLTYDPETGVFTWRVQRSQCRAGQPAGTLTYGYLHIRVEGRIYSAHRLAWLYVTGDWPRAFVDHINRDRSDNRWTNLREANKSQNNANSDVRESSRTRIKGVQTTKRGRYRSKIKVNGRQHYLGTFDSEHEASQAYAEAARAAFGQFARPTPISLDHVREGDVA